MKKKSYKIRKLEKNRKSILTDDLEHCYICKKRGIFLHEIFYGNNRINSMKYRCVVPLCLEHHTGNSGVHNNIELDKMLKMICERKFLKVYECDIEYFIKIFHRNYLDYR
nr:MAG TPA: Recombination enhancement function protein nuclease, DNase, HYDROLASE.4A [Caudoviricetes sp.]